jgi:hypothetical protein
MTAVPSDDEYDYRPAHSDETGGRVRMRSQEKPGMKVIKVDTPRVGTDGLREALKKKYGVKKH